jgi:hypothetical protein
MFLTYRHYKDTNDQNYRYDVRAFVASGKPRRIVVRRIGVSQRQRKGLSGSRNTGTSSDSHGDTSNTVSRSITSSPSEQARPKVALPRLQRQPSAGIFGPFNSVPVRESEDVQAALRICLF